ncbi:Cation efflux family protein [Perilla frutescens var. frutescens]|nr:Cation efflux family protein [Perilla frutescens var. frutescens]
MRHCFSINLIIKQYLRLRESRVINSHLRGRQAESSLYLDVDVEVDPFSSVSVAHDIGENVRRQLQQSHPEVA